MKKFSFSLQKVLEIKTQLLKNLKNELSSLNEELKIIDRDLQNLKNKYKDTNDEFLQKSSISMTIGEMTYYKIFMSGILKNIEKKEEEKVQQNKKIESKRNEIMNMNMEISSLEKLRDKELERYNEHLAKSEEIFIEEFVSNSKMAKQYAV